MRPSYSEGVRRLLKNAQAAAGRGRHRFVHTEHLLLGLLEERCQATHILKDLGYERETLKRACERRCHRGDHAMEDNLKLTPRVQHIMALAAEVMESFGHEKIDTRHVLLGIIMEEDGIAGQVLREAGVTETAIRAAVQTPATESETAPRRLRSHAPSASSKPFWRRLLRV